MKRRPNPAGFLLPAALCCLALTLLLMKKAPGAFRRGEEYLRTWSGGEIIHTAPADVTEAETVPAAAKDAAAPSAAQTPPQDAAETPQDILAAQAAFAAASEALSPAGQVRETDMREAGATDRAAQNVLVKNTTAALRPDFAALLREGPALEIADPAAPTVLIFHTHTSEGYLTLDNGVYYKEYPTRSQDPAQSVVRVGEEMCEVLRERGIGCIHDTAVYDASYNGAYARSRAGIEKILAAHPEIRIVLDVHRDAFTYSDAVMGKPTAQIAGKKAAQIMIITGAEDSGITGFPQWEDNLRFALALQAAAVARAPGLMKPIYFCPRKYNMDVTGCSLLLEVGSDANTLEEAVYAGRLLAEALAEEIIMNDKR